MRFPPPAVLATAAGHSGLGAREFVARGRRTVRPPVLGAVLGAGALVTAVGALAGLAWLAVVGLPAAGVGLAVYALAVPPPGGRLWIAVHERGLVLSRPLRAVTWDAVDFDGTLGTGDGARTPLDSLSHRLRLVTAVLRHTVPSAAARADDVIDGGGELTFGPLTVDAHGLSHAGERLAWADVATVTLVDGHTIRVVRAEPRHAWFDGNVPDPLVAAAVIAGRVGERSAAPVTAELARRDGRAAADERRAARTVAATVAAVVLLTGAGTAVAAARHEEPVPTATATPTPTSAPPAPVSTPPPSLPFDSSGWDEVCAFRRFPAAAPFTGPGPHPVAFVVSGRHTGNFPARPAAWAPPTLPATQLVACIRGSDGPVARTCEYSDGVTAQMVHARYEVTLFDARTRTLVATFTLLGANTRCLTIITTLPGATPAPQYAYVTDEQMRAALAPYVEAPR